MDWGALGKSLLSTVPVIGSILGGPPGMAVTAVGSLVGSLFGVEPDPITISQAIAADPDAYVKLKALEDKEKARLHEWQVIQLQAELANVVSARTREIELAKAGHAASWGTSIIAFIVTIGFFGMLYLLFYYGEEKLGASGLMLIGILGSAFASVVNYYLGSSLGSSEKNNLLFNSAPKEKVS